MVGASKFVLYEAAEVPSFGYSMLASYAVIRILTSQRQRPEKLSRKRVSLDQDILPKLESISQPQAG